MKDVCGNKLAVGDKVVVTDSLGLVGTYFVHSFNNDKVRICLLYTSPSPRDQA